MFLVSHCFPDQLQKEVQNKYMQIYAYTSYINVYIYKCKDSYILPILKSMCMYAHIFKDSMDLYSFSNLTQYH